MDCLTNLSFSVFGTSLKVGLFLVVFRNNWGKKLNCFWFQDKQNELSRITEKPNSVTKADPSLLEFRNFMKGGVSIFLRLNA